MLSTLTKSFFFSIAASFLSDSLSDSEKQVAEAFFRSDAGMRLLDKAEKMSNADVQNSLSALGEFLEANQANQVRAFSETSAGDKLLKQDLIHKGVSEDAILKASKARVRECRNEHGS